MKKFVIAVFVSIGSSLLVVSPVYAVEIPSPITLGNIGDAITKVSGVVTPLAVLGFIFGMIYVGYLRMFSLGNPEKEQKSVKAALALTIGFAIVALAPVIVNVIAKLIGVKEPIIT